MKRTFRNKKQKNQTHEMNCLIDGKVLNSLNEIIECNKFEPKQPDKFNG
jgi:hypothetical protein